MQNTQLKNPYPAIDLRRAYDYLSKIREKLPQQDAFGRKELLEGLGFSEKNGTGHNVVGALSHYGLLYRETNKNSTTYKITHEALDLLSAETDLERWTRLAQRSAVHPKLFHFLATEYPDNKLPVGLENRLIRRYVEVTPKNVSAIIYRYKESLKFVEAGPRPEEPPVHHRDEGEDFNQHSKAELMDFPFPLSDGTLVTINMPKVITKKDGSRISRYIAALVDSLVAEDAKDE